MNKKFKLVTKFPIDLWNNLKFSIFVIGVEFLAISLTKFCEHEGAVKGSFFIAT